MIEQMLNGNILLKKLPKQITSKLVLDTEEDEFPLYEVSAISDDILIVKLGDKVFINKHSSSKILIDDEEYYSVHYKALIAINR